MDPTHIRLEQPTIGTLGINLIDSEEKYPDYEYPKVSIIIPTFNCAQSIATTLDSILNQDYPDYEIILIDAESTDRTLQIIKGFKDDRLHLYSVSGYHRYAMLNKGITQAHGAYLNFLFPGDYYLSRQTLRIMMKLALDNTKPDMVYCGTLLRDGKSEVKILSRELTLNLLKRGQQPTSLQSCWFKTKSLKELDKFSVFYKLRGGFDLLCRFSLKPNLKFISTNRVLTDYDYDGYPRHKWSVIFGKR